MGERISKQNCQILEKTIKNSKVKKKMNSKA